MSPHNKNEHKLARIPWIFFHRLRAFIFTFGLLAIVVNLAAQPAVCDTQEIGQELSVLIVPGGKVSVPSSLSLVNTGTVFNPFSGTLPVSYRIRNGSGGPNITITIAATANFAPTGGPSVTRGDLTYTCGGATMGTPCSGTQTLSTTAATTVLSVAASACGSAGCNSSATNTENISFSLADDPTYQTGTYSTSLVLTMSSL